jgi:uncharacterized membrane protein (UPF0127 family)
MEPEPPSTPDHMLRIYRSEKPARYVLEVAGGTCRRLGISPGQKVKIPQRIAELPSEAE